MIYKGSIVKGSGGGSGDAVWGAITGTLSDQTDLANALAAKQDLIDSTHKLSASLVDGLATVATTGAYSDLSGTPTIPTVNDATITITQGGVTKGSFTLNQASNETIALEAGGSVSFDGSTINENASDELQTIGVIDKNSGDALGFWHGTEAQYNNGESQTYYNWVHSNGSAVEGNWTDVTLPASVNWTSVCYGNGKYVAVASGSTTAIYSSNGTSWNSATLPASVNWSSVCYGNGRFVAVSNGSASAAYSTDGGETWNNTTLPSSRKWRGVCYGNGKFIAVGNGGYYATSTDGGETWTEAQFYNGDYNTYYSIVYGNGKFVALANEASTSQVSADGINWTNITLPGNRMLWVSLAFGAKGFVAVANYYKVGAFSADGETWEEVTLSDTINQWTSVCYGNGKFVAVSKSTDKVAVSSDGKNWSEETVAAANKAFNTITYGGGKFVTLVANSTEEYYKDSTAASDSVYTTDATPTTASTVYYSTTIIAGLTITAVGSGTITLSDGNTYTYDSTGDQTVTYSVGELHPNYVCNIDGVGLKIGDTLIADATGNVLPSQTGNSGKYLTTDGTTASWATVSSGGLQNEATASNSISILGGDTTYEGSLIIGGHANVVGKNAIAIGCEDEDYNGTYAEAFGTAIGGGTYAGTSSLAIGFGSATGAYSIALNAYTSNDKEFAVGYDDHNGNYASYLLLDLATGKIPNDRIDGVSGSFTSQDGKTVTVTNGVITSIV